MYQNDVFMVGSTRIIVGLSTIVKVQPTAYENCFVLKILAGGGTLEIVKGTTAGGSGWGTGYPIGTNEFVSVAGPAVFYLAATGATMTASMYLGYTSGATII